MTLKDLMKLTVAYNGMKLTLDFHCDYEEYTDSKEIYDAANSDFLGRSQVTNIRVTEDGILEIEATTPEEDLGELLVNETEFDLIMGIHK